MGGRRPLAVSIQTSIRQNAVFISYIFLRLDENLCECVVAIEEKVGNGGDDSGNDLGK